MRNTFVSALVFSGLFCLVACGSSSSGDAASSNGDGGSQNNNSQGSNNGNSGGNGSNTGSNAGSGGSDGGGSTSTGNGATHPASTPPTKTCADKPNSDGIFMLSSAQGDYWVTLPQAYDASKPWPLVVGLHGCGDTAQNFVTWASAPYNQDKNAEQTDIQGYIGIAVEDVANSCWSQADNGKVLAALDDVTACFYIDQAHVTIAGYSSGAAAAFNIGLSNAQRFEGILIEDGALYDNGANEATLLANAAWKMNIANITHQSDDDYPLAKVQADWAVIQKAGFPLKTSVVAGDHSGTSEDWYSFLIPLTPSWTAP